MLQTLPNKDIQLTQKESHQVGPNSLKPPIAYQHKINHSPKNYQDHKCRYESYPNDQNTKLLILDSIECQNSSFLDRVEPKPASYIIK